MSARTFDIVIVVATAGWVFVGELYPDEQIDGLLTLRRASVIRKWGTSKGLGELALHGPLTNTVLDPIGSIWIERPHHVLFRVPCNMTAWEGRLP